MSVRLYDLLGIDPGLANRDAPAAALWPNDVASATEGFNVADDSVMIIRQLQAALTFEDVRPGADMDIQLGTAASPGGGRAGQISLAATMRIDSSGPPLPVLYLRKLPNVGIQLLPTGTDKPASVYFASDGRGHELLVEGLPVELQLPAGLVEPDKDGVPSDGDVNDFDANDEDTLAVVKSRDPQPTIFRTHVRLHLTPDKDVILEPNVPVSVDGAKISGFPVEAIYDLLLIPSPNRRDYFEWARNDLGSFIDDPPAPGALGFRSIALNLDKPPFAALKERFRDRSGVHSEDVDLVLEDVVIPVTGVGFPIPSHGTFGLRRKITDRNSIAQAYSLDHAPFRLRVYTRDGDAATQNGLYLFIDQLLFKTGSTASDTDEAPVLELNAGLVWQGDHGTQVGGTVGIGDDWLLQAGLTLGDHSPLKLTIASAVVSLHALRGGIRLRQIGDGKDCWQVLGDLSIKSSDEHGGAAAATHSAFQITTLTGRPLDLILRDVGWSFGHVQLGRSIAAPDGVQLIFGGVVRLIVEELGWVEETSGGTYFSFSGGVSIGFGGGDDRRPTSNRDDKGGNSAGIRFRRLRFLTSSTPNAPPFKLDGIFLDLHYGPVGIAGFGYVSDDVDAGFRYQEFGFGVKVEFPALAVTLSLAAEFLKGSRRPVAGGDAGAFSYFLASLQIGYIPAGPVGLYAVRVLVAYNMQPNLDPPGDNGESMVLYQWHKDHDGAIDMPRSRNLADWKPVDHSFAGGVGLGFSINSCGALFHLGAFLLLTHSDEDTMILVVADVYLLKNPEPIAFAAIEYDFKKEKFGLMAGVDLTIDKFVGGAVPRFLRDIARLSGTIYFGNEPWSLAIGHLADQRSWLGIRIDVPLLDIKLVLAVGLELTDGGPKGFGIVFSFSGGANWGIGAFIVFGSFGFIVGTWKTGSDASGIHAWAQVGFKIRVFYIFSFGADIGADITYLGKRPWYATLAAQIHIDTPWFLPDVTFRFEETWGESLPFDTSTVTQCLSSGSASSPAAPGNDSHATLHVPPLSDGNSDPGRLYSFNQLNSVSGAGLEDVHGRDDIPLVAVDADVSIEFTNPVANDSGIASDTFTSSGGDPGVQQVQDMTIRYALKSISVKRSPRFGVGAGAWTDLVAAADTELDISGGGSVHALPALSFRWDADSRADGVLAPKRLLLNCRTPYSLVVGSPRNDDEAVASDPGFPCCRDDRRRMPITRWHLLAFDEVGAGARLPGQQRFSDNGEWWRWTSPPVTINGSGSRATGHVVAYTDGHDGTVGSVDFASPAYIVVVTADTALLSGVCVVEAYRGLDLLAVETIDQSSSTQEVTLRAKVDAGFTRLVLRCKPDGDARDDVLRAAAVNVGAWQKHDGLEVVSIAYLTCDEARIVIGRVGRCRSGTDVAPAVGGGGKLAFLPNHDYAVTATVEVTVTHRTGGTKALTLSQPAYFRTKGLLGLNAVPNVGDELRPYIASAYPAAPGMLLYREEPVALAFSEGMSNLLPVDRVAAPGDPPEKAQLLELTLTIEQLASTEGAQRLTVPTNDWLDAHDGVIVVIARPPFASGGFVTTVIRRAPSTDNRVLRFERALDAGDCVHDPLHSSQVLLHEPIAADGTPGLWEPQTGFRATVRAKDGPYTERAAFVSVDRAAFEYLSDGGPVALFWNVDAGSLVAAGAGGRQYAAFGEPDWNHVQISARIEPAGGAAGVAVGVSGSTPVQQAFLALVDGGDLVLVRRTGAADHELARSALPAGAAAAPIDLHVTAFDDRIRAQVGDVTVEGDRGPVREGRLALVANGSARFDSLLVDSLDMYQVGFHTSRYRSFVEHIALHDDVVPAHDPNAMGAPPATTAAQVLTAESGAIAAAMSASADPQARESLFAKTLNDLGLPQLDRCDRVTFTRLVDGPLTTAFLLESPEPVSFLHDVTLTLLHRTWVYRPWWDDVGLTPGISDALKRVRLEDGVATAPPHVVSELVGGGYDIAHVNDGSVDVYAASANAGERTVAGTLQASLDAAAARRAGLAELVDAPPGTIAAIRADRTIGGITMVPWHHGSWVHQDDPVPFVLLANGDETRALVLPSGGLASGTYILDFVLDRTRWQSATADPEARYHEEASVELSW